MKTTYRKTALQRTAFHEAGHAAMFFTQGRKFRHVTIVADETKCSLGHLLHDALNNFHPDENDDCKRGGSWKKPFLARWLVPLPKESLPVVETGAELLVTFDM